ncbi:MAG: TatD family hydrolase [Ignavibacteria bacterium]|jgi:TatD DNase family protein|nr:TatD family hydrolase [Ignavibacteria bacterium]
MIIDTHAHLYFPELLGNISEIMNNALEAGISKIIIPAVDLKTADIALDLSSKYEQIFAAVGYHPCDISDADESVLYRVENLCDNDKVVAIGETGLDYYWDKSYIDKQKYFFRSQIELSLRKKLPIIIHTRDSIGDTIDIVKDYKDVLTGQFHCFSGNESDLDEVLTGTKLYVSFCGNITYRKNTSAALLGKIPVGRILSETDSPFLPPVPYRGKKNQPAFVVNTIKFIADEINFDYDEFLKILYGNAINLFPGLRS